MSSLHWSAGDKLLAVFGTVAGLALAAWLAFPSSHYIKEISVEVKGGEVRFVRELPHGAVTAEWQSEITLLDGFECNSGGWRIANYQPVPGNTVRYALGEWASTCLDAGPPFYLTTTRRVLLAGVIPLRKSVSVTDVQGDVPDGVIVVVPEE